jgi:hypothetical protein
MYAKYRCALDDKYFYFFRLYYKNAPTMDNRCGYETKWDEMRCKRGVRRSRNKKFE